MIVYFNDKFVNEEEALLHVTDMSIQRSYAIFDFFRTVNGVPLFMEDHLNRFFASAAAMHLSISKSREEIRQIVQELLQRTALSEAGIRLMLTGGYSADGYHPGTPNLLIICNPVKTATANDFEKGYSVITYEHQRQLPHIKSINYLVSVWLQPLLKEKQADDVLYYNKESLTEFPRANVFIVTANNILVTPARNILYGITRKNIINLAAGMMPVVERDISVEELLHASEVFLTATTKKIIPVVKINDKPVGNAQPGTVTKKLYEKFIKLETKLTHLVSR